MVEAGVRREVIQTDKAAAPGRTTVGVTSLPAGRWWRSR